MADLSAPTEALPEQGEQPAPNGVFIVKEVTEDGNLNVGVQTVGSVQQTEVLTLLSVALRAVKADLGL